jgi:uncharacterized protein (DUF433 family)
MTATNRCQNRQRDSKRVIGIPFEKRLSSIHTALGGGMSDFDRITQSPDMMGGRPCIRGMRVTVGMIVGQIGAGVSIDELLADYPYLEREDILQALRYAAWRSDEREIMLASA